MSAEPERNTVYFNDLHWNIVYQKIAMHEPPTRDNSTNLNIAVSTVHRIYWLFDEKGKFCGPCLHGKGWIAGDFIYAVNCILYSVGVILENPLMWPKWCSCKVLNNTHVQVLGPKTFQRPFGHLSLVSSKLYQNWTCDTIPNMSYRQYTWPCTEAFQQVRILKLNRVVRRLPRKLYACTNGGY